MPAWAMTWAIPLPMVPAPTTSARSMDAGSQFTGVSLVSRVNRSREFVNLRSSDCTCQGHEASGALPI